jgi:kynureninase
LIHLNATQQLHCQQIEGMASIEFQERSQTLNLPINSLAFATSLDSEDELRSLRDDFILPPTPSDCSRSSSIYLCGNSLGLQPRGLDNQIQIQLRKWSEQGVEAHFDQPTPWLTIDDIVVDSMARLVGAKPSEVVVMNSLTTNLHLMMCAFYNPTSDRYKIITEKKAFPSDTYAVASQIKHHNLNPSEALIEIAPRDGEHTLRIEDILKVSRLSADILIRCRPSRIMATVLQWSCSAVFNISLANTLTSKQSQKKLTQLAPSQDGILLMLSAMCRSLSMIGNVTLLVGVHTNTSTVAQDVSVVVLFTRTTRASLGHLRRAT